MDKIINISDFRMPAEWEKQDSTWLAWPHNKNDWPGLYQNIPSIFREIIFQISKYQKVNLLVQDQKQITKIQRYLLKKSISLSKVNIHVIRTNRIWVRDTGPIYLINKKKKEKILLNWTAGTLCTPDDCTAVADKFPGAVAPLAPEGSGYPSF